ncbi:AI-2E family transporter [Frisingicoccus caecimuris]|nr:AI-2E family transporter [Frisingicoccus caecimuris]MCR1917578.1 AI-2E family transporter [Frisingicoccus caecimuris]
MAEKNTEEKKENVEKLSIRGMIRQATVYLFVLAVSIIFIFILFKWSEIHKAFGGLIKILAPVIAGLVIAYILLPVVDFVERRLLKIEWAMHGKTPNRMKKIVRGISVACAMAFALGIIFILGYMVLPQLAASIAQIIMRFPSYTRQVTDWFESLQYDGQFSQDLQDIINQTMNYLQTWMKDDFYPQLRAGINTFTLSIMNVLQFLYNIVIGAIISIYVMMSTNTFTGQAKKIAYAVLKPDIANSLIEVVRHCNQIFGGFITGKLIDSAIIGVVCFIVLNLIHMPYAMLVSVIVGVTNVIPFFGPYIGAIPSVILIGLTNFRQGIIFLVFIIILQQIDGNILGPKILGNSTGLSPFWVVFAILVGGGVFGFPGMLLGVPVFAVIYYLIKTFVEYALYKKRMPLETQKYIRADGYDIETEELIYSDNAAETRKERRERYGSYKNVSIERDKKREKQKANAAAEKDGQDE